MFVQIVSIARSRRRLDLDLRVVPGRCEFFHSGSRLSRVDPLSPELGYLGHREKLLGLALCLEAALHRVTTVGRPMLDR